MEHLFLSIQRLPSSGCLASLSGKGVTQTKVSFPESLYENTIQLLESKRGSNKNTLHPGLPVDIAKLEQQIINQLQKALLSGRIGEALIARQAAHAEGENLQLVIQSADNAIRNLPWETVTEFKEFGESGGVVNLNMVRTMQPSCTAFQAQQIPAPTAAPLKLLFVTALPENISERGKELQIEDEQRKLIEAVGNLEATGDRRPKMVIEFLDVASLEEMTAALKARRHDILHISGHGGFNEKINQAVLHLENEDGDHLPTEAKDFAQALRGHDSLRLVVLSACETAVVGPDGGMVEAVAAIGVPAVLGMRFTVGDAEAKLFTTHFYQHLVNGAPITDALSRARLELWKAAQEWKQAYPDHPRLGEWFTPVLYLNGAMGALVDANLPYQLPADFYPSAAEGKRLIGSGFIGRKRQLIQMRRAFRAGRHVCLAGMGGMGKTTLAEAFAANYENGAYDPIILRGGTEIHEFGILNQIVLDYGWRHGGKDLRSLRCVIENGDMPILNRLHYVIWQCLKDEKVILIFDNFEDLQDQSGGENSRGIVSEELRAFLGYFIGHCPAGCHLLFTTRYRIKGLPDAVEVVNLDKLSPAEQYRWLSYSPWLRYLSSEERAAVYRRLDGLPRAFEFLEALAANDETFDWETLEIEFELAKVQEKVFADLILGRIYGLLSEDLQRVFLVASVFFTRTPLGALVAVMEGEFSEDVLRGCLERLLDWGLCFWDGELSETEVHSLTRKWLDKKSMLDLSEQIRIAKRAGEYYDTYQSVENWTYAITYFEMSGTWESFASTSMKLQHHYQRIGNYVLASELCRNLINKDVDEQAKAGSLNNIAFYEKIRGNYELALLLCEQAFQIIHKTPDNQLKIKILNNIAQIHKANGNHGEALEKLHLTLKMSLGIGDQFGISAALNNIGEILRLRGDLHDAKRHFEESYRINKAAGNRKEEGEALNNMATIAFDQQDYEIAQKFYELSLSIKEELGDYRGFALGLSNLGTMAMASDRDEEALELFHVSLEIREEIHDRLGESINLNNIGNFYLKKASFPEAMSYFQRALQISNEIGDISGEALTLTNIGQTFADLYDPLQAIQYFEKGYSLAKTIGEKHTMAKSLGLRGRLFFQLRMLEKSIPFLIKSDQIYKEINLGSPMDSTKILQAISNSIGAIRYQEILATLDLENL